MSLFFCTLSIKDDIFQLWLTREKGGNRMNRRVLRRWILTVLNEEKSVIKSYVFIPKIQ